jgi:hypothetical protein
MSTHVPFQQEQVLLWNTSILRSLHSNFHAIRMRHQEFRIRRLERVCHLFDIVRGTGARDFPSDTQSGVHCDRIPDAVLAKERDGVAFLQPIALLESGTEVRCCFFDFKPVQTLFGEGIGVAG